MILKDYRVLKNLSVLVVLMILLASGLFFLPNVLLDAGFGIFVWSALVVFNDAYVYYPVVIAMLFYGIFIRRFSLQRWAPMYLPLVLFVYQYLRVHKYAKGDCSDLFVSPFCGEEFGMLVYSLFTVVLAAWFVYFGAYLAGRLFLDKKK